MIRRLLALGIVVTTAFAIASPAAPIIGGEFDEQNQYGNVGAFGVVVDGGFFEVCSGTLIDERAVLTAGHCTVFFEELESELGYDVVFTLDPSPTATSTFYDATTFYTHPAYVDELRGNSKCGLLGQCTTDVGVAELGTTVSGVTPATLPSLNLLGTIDPKTQTFTVVGYGLEGFSNANTPIGDPGGRRKFAELTAIPGRDVTGARFLKLTGQHTKSGTCFGDSGGPVFLGSSQTVVAVTSFGQSWVCASMGYYTRLDTAEVLGWLTTTLATIRSHDSGD